MSPFQLLGAVLASTWRVLREGSPFLLAGLALAGLLHEFVRTSAITAALGRGKWRSIFVATLFGAPLPLCSCGVIPAAVSLRRKGASKGATLAFLVSTPETGIDSLFLTWGLLGPFFALVRAVTGVGMGVLVGGAAMSRGGADREEASEISAPILADAEEQAGRSDDPLVERLRRAARYGFIELFGDLAFWLLLGFAASGLLLGLLPEGFFARVLPGEPLSFLAMALAGALTYVCASASTPLAAAMIVGGLNPGAALVYLLSGPATNPATLLLVWRLFGRRTTSIYLATVFAVSLGAGLALNRILPSLAPAAAAPAPAGGPRDVIETVSALALATLMALVLRQRGFRRDLAELAGQSREVVESLRAVRWRPLLRRTGFALAAVLAVWWLSSSFFRVRPGERAVVRVLGRVESADVGPGLHWTAPVPFSRVERVAADAVRTVEIGFRVPPISPARPALDSSSLVPAVSPSFSPEIPRLPFESQFVTGDENVIEVTAVVQYRVGNVALFRLASERAETAVLPIARALLVEEIGKLPVDAIYSTARGQVEAETLARLRPALEKARTGLEPLGVRLLYVHAPDDVHQAFRDVASAAEDSATSRNLAFVESEGSVRQARGEASRLVLEADSSRVEAVEGARGATASFVRVRREYEKAPEPTRLRLYLETVERALAPLNKWIKPAGVHGLELWLSRGSPSEVSLAPPEAATGNPEALPIPIVPSVPPQ